MGVEEAKLEEELVDKPGSTIGTKISVLHCIRIPFFMRCGFWPLIHSQEYSCSSQSFPIDNTAGVFSRTLIVKKKQFFGINCGLFMRLHFTIGCFHRRTTSRRRQNIHCSRIQVLFADHVHRRTGVYNKISFPLFYGFDGEDRHQFSAVEKNAVFCFSLKNLGIFLAGLHAASRAPCSCHSVSSWDRSSHFGALGLRWWCSPGQIYPSEGFWSRMLAWRNTASVNWTHRIGFSMFELFRKIDKNFGGSISWNTQPNCRVFFNIATALLSPFSIDLLLGCSSTWRCA